MASSQKMTIQVERGRTLETIVFRATGRVGKVSMSIPSHWNRGLSLSPTTDEKAFWSDVLTHVQAFVLSL